MTLRGDIIYRPQSKLYRSCAHWKPRVQLLLNTKVPFIFVNSLLNNRTYLPGLMVFLLNYTLDDVYVLYNFIKFEE